MSINGLTLVRQSLIDDRQSRIRQNSISLHCLFWSFLKIGSTAFGGLMSLIAVVEYIVVEKMKLLTHEDILDGISLTTFLPGPISTNVVVYAGYRIRGIWGAFFSLLGVVLPSFVLVVILAILYFKAGEITTIHNMFLGFTPAVSAIILSTAWQMSRKTLNHKYKVIIASISALLLVTVGGVYITITIMVISGIIGWLFFGKYFEQSSTQKILFKASSYSDYKNYNYLSISLPLTCNFPSQYYYQSPNPPANSSSISKSTIFRRIKSKWYYQKTKYIYTKQSFDLNNYQTVCLGQFSLFSLVSRWSILQYVIKQNILAKKKYILNKKKFFFSFLLLPGALLLYWILSLIIKKYIIVRVLVTFATISVMLFGGAYVSIPLIQEIIVHDLNWLTQQEFTYGLAVGQVTPGPIVISAAFIGYKVAKLSGAIAATIGIFLPPFLLTIAGANLLERIKQSPQIQAAMNGIRPAVIGMIFAAFWIVGQTASPTWVSGLIFVGSLLALVRWRINVVWIIICVGLVSIFLY